MEDLSYKNYKFLADFFKEESVTSIFVLSWDNIYIYSNNCYYRSDFFFKDSAMYSNFVEEIMYKTRNNEKYGTLFNNIDIHIHKWNSENFWINLVKK